MEDTTIDELLETMDGWVASWHDGPDVGVSLHRYLGMTWGEYAEFVSRPREWAQNILDKKRKMPTDGSERSFYEGSDS